MHTKYPVSYLINILYPVHDSLHLDNVVHSLQELGRCILALVDRKLCSLFSSEAVFQSLLVFSLLYTFIFYRDKAFKWALDCPVSRFWPIRNEQKQYNNFWVTSLQSKFCAHLFFSLLFTD